MKESRGKKKYGLGNWAVPGAVGGTPDRPDVKSDFNKLEN
jgi:hypothetical protein